MMMWFNIDIDSKPLINVFRNELESVKKLLESDTPTCGKFYLNIFYTIGDHDEIDLSKAATLKLCKEWLIIYSKNTMSTMFIPYVTMRSLEIVEVR